jgi:hypothetical protein
MIIGDLAASLLGRPRFTNDIDLIILDLDDRIPEFIQKLKNFGIEPRWMLNNLRPNPACYCCVTQKAESTLIFQWGSYPLSGMR